MQGAAETRGRDDYGRTTYTARKPTPYCTAHGFRMAHADWTRTEDGWDCEWDFDGLPLTYFETKEACEAAIAARNVPKMEVAA